MDQFFKYFFTDFGKIFEAFLDIFRSLITFVVTLFNFPDRSAAIKEAAPNFKTGDWVLLIIAYIILIALVVLAIIGLVKLFKKILRFRVSPKKYEEIRKQLAQTQKDLLRANHEKDRLLAMKSGLGLPGEEGDFGGHGGTSSQNNNGNEEEEEGEEEEYIPNSNRNTMESPCIDPAESRFFRLTTVDNFYKQEYVVPQYEEDFTLAQLCDRFRRFAAKRLRLYYDIDMMRYFISSMGAARIIILQGISGTGKTSLPYAFGRFVQKESTVVSVQPSWRERTELYGYFNEFTKRYTETDFLRAVYEGNFYRDPHILILDEMNIARVEYYFAEMLSILELPRKEEWKVDIVTATWDNDPVLVDHGSIPISDNLWFVGTINNDDSTFAVADKVYDRAIPIDLDSRADAFDCEDAEPIYMSTDKLNALFDEAKQTYQVSQEVLDKLEECNAYLIKTFRLAFGNRIMKQLKDFVPCFIACGGTEMQAVDFIVAKKVLRKFESLSLSFMKDELTKFQNYLDKLFGKNVMAICKEYVEILKKNN